MTTAPWAAGPTPTRIDVGPLSLERPRPDDAAFYVQLHRDARTYAHAPEAMAASNAEALVGFEQLLAHWERRGLGYFVVRENGEAIGISGVHYTQADDVGEYLNLYYRFVPEVAGRGLGRTAARAVVEWATEFAPQLPIVARMKSEHPASLRTAEASGLLAWRLEVDRLLRSPVAEHFWQPPGDDVVSDLLQLWTDVTADGGAVGFPPGTPAEQIAPTLAKHLDDMAAGLAHLTTLRSPTGELLGFGWWYRYSSSLLHHVLELKRFQVSPRYRRRHLGRLLLTSMHRWARDEGTIELLQLDYRSGLGSGDFYAGSGYVEVGRLPGLLQPTPGDFRDAVAMMRRVDGGPLRFDGRT